MVGPGVAHWLAQAQQLLAKAEWAAAERCLMQALALAPGLPQLHHHLAVCRLARGQAQQALQAATEALRLGPPSAATQVLRGHAMKALRQHEDADAAYVQALRWQPDHADALLSRADLAINVFGMPLQAIGWAHGLLNHPVHGVDAQLTTLMANVYDRNVSAQTLSDAVCRFSARHLQADSAGLPPLGPPGPRRGGPQGGRPRVALISPLFCASPVYFLTIAGWRHVARGSDLVVFSRGHKNDWASQAFRELAHEWHDVQELPADLLARRIHAADIDVLYDLGGWMDPVALRALSVKPARQMFKWVGGQSLTTGLRCFDGWIGDEWQSPLSLQRLYSEPLVNIPGGYASYTPPAYMPSASMHRSPVPVVFSNPAKLSRAFLAWLAKVPGTKRLVHHQYRYERVRERVLEALGPGASVEFVCPQSHREALQILGRHDWMFDTFPYSSGLTAREAVAMGMRVRAVAGELFCERHSLHLSSESAF
jgi:predicted O-linked N-acetylglucosamine transferase (SPINDLY family)